MTERYQVPADAIIAAHSMSDDQAILATQRLAETHAPLRTYSGDNNPTSLPPTLAKMLSPCYLAARVLSVEVVPAAELDEKVTPEHLVAPFCSFDDQGLVRAIALWVPRDDICPNAVLGYN